MSSIPLALEGSSNDSASKTSDSEMEMECKELAIDGKVLNGGRLEVLGVEWNESIC